MEKRSLVVENIPRIIIKLQKSDERKSENRGAMEILIVALIWRMICCFKLFYSVKFFTNTHKYAKTDRHRILF